VLGPNNEAFSFSFFLFFFRGRGGGEGMRSSQPNDLQNENRACNFIPLFSFCTRHIITEAWPYSKSFFLLPFCYSTKINEIVTNVQFRELTISSPYITHKAEQSDLICNMIAHKLWLFFPVSSQDHTYITNLQVKKAKVRTLKTRETCPFHAMNDTHAHREREGREGRKERNHVIP